MGPPPPTGPPRCCQGYLVKQKTSHMTSLAKSHQWCHTTFRIKPVCSGPFTVWSNPPHSHCAPKTHRTNLPPHDMTLHTSVPLHVPEPCLYWDHVPSLFTPIQNSIPYQTYRKWNLLWEPSFWTPQAGRSLCYLELLYVTQISLGLGSLEKQGKNMGRLSECFLPMKVRHLELGRTLGRWVFLRLMILITMILNSFPGQRSKPMENWKEHSEVVQRLELRVCSGTEGSWVVFLSHSS